MYNTAVSKHHETTAWLALDCFSKQRDDDLAVYISSSIYTRSDELCSFFSNCLCLRTANSESYKIPYRFQDW